MTLITNAVLALFLQLAPQIESSHNPLARGDGGRSLGLYQISLPLIQDVNRAYRTRYTHQDALVPSIAREIAVRYLTHRNATRSLELAARTWNKPNDPYGRKATVYWKRWEEVLP
jgi:hypothetical protein